MGLTCTTIEYIYQNRILLKGRKIATLGVLYPYIRNERQKKYITGLIPEIDLRSPNFAKHLFCDICQAESCIAIDVSPYQGAEQIIDLNKSIPNDLLSKFDIIYDAGTFEHLSNTRQALSNIFSLLTENGTCFFGQPCNGWVDHGFFQFSPTFYKDLCVSNPMLQLNDLFLVSEQGSKLDIVGVKGQLIAAFTTSNRKVNLCGRIKKIENGQITFNFIQEKYREWHETGDRVQNIKPLKKFLRFTSDRFLLSPIVPFNIKHNIVKLENFVRRILRG